MLAVSEEDWKNQKLDLSGEFEVGFHFLEAISRNQNQNIQMLVDFGCSI